MMGHSYSNQLAMIIPMASEDLPNKVVRLSELQWGSTINLNGSGCGRGLFPHKQYCNIKAMENALLPSGEHTKSNGKLPFIADFPINSMVIFHSFLYVHQRVPSVAWTVVLTSSPRNLSFWQWLDVARSKSDAATSPVSLWETLTWRTGKIHPFSMGKSTIYYGKSPFSMGSHPLFIMERSTILNG